MLGREAFLPLFSQCARICSKQLFSRAHAMKSGPDTPETEDAGSKKRKGSDDNDLDILQDYLKKKKDKRKDYGLEGLRRVRDPSESSTKSEASSDEDQQSQNISKDQSSVESDPSDQPMADVAQPAPPPKRRYTELSFFAAAFTYSNTFHLLRFSPGRPPKPKFIVPIEIEPYGPRGRRCECSIKMYTRFFTYK